MNYIDKTDTGNNDKVHSIKKLHAGKKLNHVLKEIGDELKALDKVKCSKDHDMVKDDFKLLKCDKCGNDIRRKDGQLYTCKD